MGHEDAGHYAAKHPEGTEPDPKIAEAVKNKMENGRIKCAAAHKIAEETGASPAEVGQTMDLLECRLTKCQMGLFGHGHENSKLVKPAESIPSDMEEAVRNSMEDGRISCANCWNIAEKLNRTRMETADACEKLGIKVSPCQLGAF